jgi:type I restriction enzyme, S subunit
MKGWTEFRIEELCKVGRGASPRPIDNPIFFEYGTIPWVKIADATASGKKIYKTKEFVNEHGASFSRHLPAGSLILATSGVSLGQTKFLGVDACIHDGWLYFDEFNDKIDKEYFYYRLLLLSDYLHGQSYGAAIQNVNTSILRSIKLNLPPIEIQKQIASILSTCDDLIENNFNRIKLLEEFAQKTFEEWFVKFNIKGELQEINEETHLPKGWKRMLLGDTVDFLARGISPKYVEENGITVINQKCIRNGIISLGQSRLTSSETRIQKEKYLQLYDIVVNSTGAGTLGRIAQVTSLDKDITVDSHVSIIRANKKILSPILLGFSIKSQEDLITSMGKGSTNQLELSRNDLKDLVEVIVPDFNSQKKFDLLIEPTLKLISNLSNQNRCLKEALSILLPRLMNGDIDLEIAQEETLAIAAELSPKYKRI